MNTALKASFESTKREIYRDELNFAEFPLASLSTSLPKDQKTLEFTDEIFDKSKNQKVTRKLTITASDKYGLPTAMDDEVILGLIQLTGKTDFAERKVFFTRYELLKLLNWSDDTRNYDRIEQSLNRWLGVTLYYDKSWWSKEEQSWVNEGFHILDHVTVFDKERQIRRAKVGEGNAGKSSFVWNEVVFNSFQSGHLKRIDFEFYKALKSAVSKRMYRFLDKRFYMRASLEFDLKTFACEHLGLSKNYHNGELKRVLRPAILELENQGFLKKLPDGDRFLSLSRGEWKIAFVKSSDQRIALKEELPELVKALADRGITLASARTIVSKTEEAEIREKLAFFDWLSAKKDPRIKDSPAGFLYNSITNKFNLPDDYKATNSARAKSPERKVVPITQKVGPSKLDPKVKSDRENIDKYWNSIPTGEQDQIEEGLVKSAPNFLKEQYVNGKKEKGILFQTVRQAMIDQYVRAKLAGVGTSEQISVDNS